MDTLGEINELFTTKMCSPAVVFGVVLVITCISVYLSRSTLQRYNTQKMENLYSLYTMQEFKFMLILGVTMYGLCQYNKNRISMDILNISYYIRLNSKRIIICSCFFGFTKCLQISI